MSTSSLKLDPSIFNASLYKQITDTHLPNVNLSGEDLDPGVMKRWFTTDPSYDSTCRSKFLPALEAIGPEHLSTPHDAPFLAEIERVAQENPNDDGKQAAWTALSLIILLDQMTRNIYRTDEGLRKVFTHYDEIAYKLAFSLSQPGSTSVSNIVDHPQWRHSMAHKLWFYMPFMHSEDISAHDYARDLLAKTKAEIEPLEGKKGSKMFLEGHDKAEQTHREILERFGRYPHRNGALGRVSTEEEKEFLEGGGATFGVGQKKDEL
jgi:uncharacterized protein (DUF924 family)